MRSATQAKTRLQAVEDRQRVHGVGLGSHFQLTGVLLTDGEGGRDVHVRSQDIIAGAQVQLGDLHKIGQRGTRNRLRRAAAGPVTTDVDLGERGNGTGLSWFALLPFLAFVALLSLQARRTRVTLRSLSTSGASRTRIALRSLQSGSASHTGVTLRSLRTDRAFRTRVALGSLQAGGTLRASRAGRAGIAFVAFIAFIALCSLRTGRPLRAGRAGGTLESLRALRALRALLTARCLAAALTVAAVTILSESPGHRHATEGQSQAKAAHVVGKSL